MRILTYWIAECLNDSACYNIRAQTRREVVEYLAELPDSHRFGSPVKVWVRYKNNFDLMELCLSEGGGYWEYRPKTEAEV